MIGRLEYEKVAHQEEILLNMHVDKVAVAFLGFLSGHLLLILLLKYVYIRVSNRQIGWEIPSEDFVN